MNCEVPGCTRDACEPHHVMTRGAWGPAAEVEVNKIPVCRICHTLWGDKGDEWMMETYEELKAVVEEARAAVYKRWQEIYRGIVNVG